MAFLPNNVKRIFWGNKGERNQNNCKMCFDSGPPQRTAWQQRDGLAIPQSICTRLGGTADGRGTLPRPPAASSDKRGVLLSVSREIERLTGLKKASGGPGKAQPCPAQSDRASGTGDESLFQFALRNSLWSP